MGAGLAIGRAGGRRRTLAKGARTAGGDPRRGMDDDGDRPLWARVRWGNVAAGAALVLALLLAIAWLHASGAPPRLPPPVVPPPIAAPAAAAPRVPFEPAPRVDARPPAARGSVRVVRPRARHRPVRRRPRAQTHPAAPEFALG